MLPSFRNHKYEFCSARDIDDPSDQVLHNLLRYVPKITM